MPVHLAKSEEQTIALARDLAAAAKPGETFLLEGPLGAGKSVFARAFIRALCGEEIDVPSPTFTLVQLYETPQSQLWHFDLYRLQEPDEIFEIGWEESFGGIRLIEWPSRLGPHLPQKAHHIRIEPLSEWMREISIDEH